MRWSGVGHETFILSRNVLLDLIRDNNRPEGVACITTVYNVIGNVVGRYGAKMPPCNEAAVCSLGTELPVGVTAVVSIVLRQLTPLRLSASLIVRRNVTR